MKAIYHLQVIFTYSTYKQATLNPSNVGELTQSSITFMLPVFDLPLQAAKILGIMIP